MSDEAYSELPFYTSEDTVVPTPRKCSHPKERRLHLEDGGWQCGVVGCERIVAGAKVRAGRRARKRGNAAERTIAKRLGGERRGMFGGPDDVVVGSLWVVQSKHGSSYWPKRLVAALAALPRTEGRVPLLIIGDGSPGRHARRLVVLDERDWNDLHGPITAPALGGSDDA